MVKRARPPWPHAAEGRSIQDPTGKPASEENAAGGRFQRSPITVSTGDKGNCQGGGILLFFDIVAGNEIMQSRTTDS